MLEENTSMKKWWKIGGLILLCALFCAAIGMALFGLTPGPLSAKKLDFTELAQTVVLIEPGVGMGSGVIIDPAGYILTNYHVVEECSPVSITYKTVANELRVTVGEVLFGWPDGDLALIKIQAKDLRAIPFGDSSKIKPGDTVYSIGHPFALAWTITRGIVSTFHKAENGVQIIQHDAGIAPGNSGGLLLNDRGELVGINSSVSAIQIRASAEMFYGLPDRPNYRDPWFQLLPLRYSYALSGNLARAFALGVIAVTQELDPEPSNP